MIYISKPNLTNKQVKKLGKNTYIELANLYQFKTIECVKDNQIRTIEDINEEMYNIIKKEI